ncbi:autotransporter assembly complex protein TamA [Cardiobacterium valvarum]|uniref:Translocation and assembly module subunit TamA n=1 Tax=Cardiobacterium valvarum TaxID=194702 RepID=A0A381EDJ7_9GAMM|nr:autotransporter assembly complex family protein [Cardiobacterium valvarum]SUX25056.1 outer membrane protein assembly factor YaeT [Cardiobacterium valvarum]
MQHTLLTAFLTALLALPLHAKPAKPAIKAKTAATAAPAQPDAANLMGKTILDIDIRGIDNIQQHDNAKTYLTLEKSVGEKIEQPDYIQYLIENGREEIRRSQQPFGYYNSEVDAHVQDEGDGLRITYTVHQNQITKLNKVNVQITGEAAQDEAFQEALAENPLKQGGVLNHETYENYKARLAALASARGYFDAEFREHNVQVNPANNTAEVNLVLDSGMRYTFEAVDFNDTPLDPDLLQRFVQFKPGQPYLSSDVATLQQDLQGSGYFAEALVGDEPNRTTKTVPVNAQLTMDENKHYVLGVGYSTDGGVRGKVEFDRRWINSRGHQFSSKLYASKKNSSLDTLYRIPAANPTSDYYYFRLGGHIKTDNYDSRKLFGEGGYNFRLGDWEHRYGLVAAWEKYNIGLTKDKTLLVYPQGQWTYTSTKNRLNPKDGYQFRFGLLAAGKTLLSDANLVQGNIDARYLQSIGEKQRLIARASLGASWTDNFDRIPPSLRYFAGGDRSIRGYAFENIGSRDSEGNNIGGRYLGVGGLEYEYYFKPGWALAAFVDGGDAFVDDFKMRIGAGAGVHWQSPVGPIKVDVGHGFDKQYGDKVRLHISIGAELDL